MGFYSESEVDEKGTDGGEKDTKSNGTKMLSVVGMRCNK